MPLRHRWDYPLHPELYVAGTAVLLGALVLLRLAHAHLGTNGSVSLEIYCLGQALLIPSWVAGWSRGSCS